MKKLIFLILLSLPIMAQVFDRNGYGNDSGTELLLHMDGVNDGTVFTDASKNNFTVTDSNVVTKTAIKQFGTASGYFPDSVFLSVPDNDAWSITNKDFTVDFWVYRIDTSGNDYVWSTGVFPNFYDIVLANNVRSYLPRFRIFVSSVSEVDLFGTTQILENIWYHLALTKNGNVYTMYVNGKNEGSDTSSSNLNPTGGLRIGWYTDVFYMNGYIDEFRYSNFCRWNKNFTPPNRAY